MVSTFHRADAAPCVRQLLKIRMSVLYDRVAARFELFFPMFRARFGGAPFHVFEFGRSESEDKEPPHVLVRVFFKKMNATANLFFFSHPREPPHIGLFAENRRNS